MRLSSTKDSKTSEIGGAFSAVLTAEDQGRANLYRLLARLLAGAPDADLLGLLRGLEDTGGPVGAALAGLADAARESGPVRLARDYHDLFIGVGRGELVPFGSWYVAGFLHEKPLARLRGDLGALELGRTASTHEPEDHVAMVCETMALIVEGRAGAKGPEAERRFFDAHLRDWLGAFFRDLEGAAAARGFYAALGRLGGAFVTVEAQALAFHRAPAA